MTDFGFEAELAAGLAADLAAELAADFNRVSPSIWPSTIFDVFDTRPVTGERAVVLEPVLSSETTSALATSSAPTNASKRGV